MHHFDRRQGFTLVEVLAVVALIGLITATAILRFGTTTQNARLEWAITRISAADAALRNHASRHEQPTQLKIDLRSGSVEQTFDSNKRASSRFDIGSGMTLTQFLSTRGRKGYGEVTIDYTAHGTSESFAIELTSKGRKPVWLLFAGVTGQLTRLEDEKHVESFLEAGQ